MRAALHPVPAAAQASLSPVRLLHRRALNTASENTAPVAAGDIAHSWRGAEGRRQASVVVGGISSLARTRACRFTLKKRRLRAFGACAPSARSERRDGWPAPARAYQDTPGRARVCLGRARVCLGRHGRASARRE